MDNQNNASSGSFDKSQSDIQGSDMPKQSDAQGSGLNNQSDIQGIDITGVAHAIEDALGGIAKKDPWAGGPVIGNSPPSSPATDVTNLGTPTGPITADSTDTSTPNTTTPDEEFVGSGGVGSAEYLANLHKAHEEAGDDFNSAYGEDTPKA